MDNKRGPTHEARTAFHKAGKGVLLSALSVFLILALIGSYYWLSQKPTVPLEKVTIAVGSGLHRCPILKG